MKLTMRMDNNIDEEMCSISDHHEDMDYTKQIADIRNFIRENEQSLLDDWFRLIRQVSVSETGEGVEECCDWIREKMEMLGLEVQKYDVRPFPVLVGRWGRDPKKKTILLYAHYDVKPAGDRSKWRIDPFQPEVIEGKVYGRGSADNKSPLMAHLEAFAYFRNRGREVPVNLIFLFEGCEESGSLGLPEFLEAHREELRADLVFFSDGSKDPSGKPIIALGCKGCLSLTIRVKTMAKNVHSRYAPVLPSAAWELVELLSKLKQGDQVLVPGFYDGIRPLTQKEREILEKLPSSEQELNEIYRAKPQNFGKSFYSRLFFRPTFNIQTVHSGASGVVPAEAEAFIDIRLAPGQNGTEVFEKIQNYVAQLGYDNAEVLFDGCIPPSQTDVTTPYLPPIEELCSRIYGSYILYPCRPSSAPDYLWTDILKLPAIQVRWSDADSDNHAPNEHLSIREYFDGIVLTACVFSAVAGISD